MDDDSEEIFISGLLKRYCKRPAKLENLTLADWAARYDRTEKQFVKQTNEIDVDGLPSETFIDDNKIEDNNVECTKNTCSKTKKRTKARIIRSVWYNKEAEPEKHYWDLMMLFTPWRNEETDL